MTSLVQKARAGELPAIAVALGGLLFSCSAAMSPAAYALQVVDQWVNRHLKNGEQLLCAKNIGGEFFFLARQEGMNRVKIGERIDITGDSVPLTTIVAWRFRNENNTPLSINTVPETVKETIVNDDGKFFGEIIQYRDLNLENSIRLRVFIDIKKCPTSDCERQRVLGPGDRFYRVQLCDVGLGGKERR